MNIAAKEAPRPAPAESRDSPPQDEVNRRVYFARGVYLYYLSKSPMPVETACFAKYSSHFREGDVLDIGIGAGRTARYLAPRARRYEAIDYSPVMVKYVRKTMPEISVRQADFRDMRIFGDATFDSVLATANVIDALSHSDRLRALREASRVLRPDGILAFSTHNLGYKRAFSEPQLKWSWNPVKLALSGIQYGLGSWNHRRVAPLRKRTPEYALLNDTGHFYSCLHYYSARSTVALQLAEAGMRLLEVLDGQGRALDETADDSENPWLFYIAQKTDRPPCATSGEPRLSGEIQ